MIEKPIRLYKDSNGDDYNSVLKSIYRASDVNVTY